MSLLKIPMCLIVFNCFTKFIALKKLFADLQFQCLAKVAVAAALSKLHSY